MSDLVLAPDKIALIKRTIAKEATDDELQLFLHICKRAGLDPLAKQIYFQKRINRKTGESNITIITGIDGYRATAAKTGEYAGSDDPVFDNEEQPTKATVTVWRIVGGQRCPFSASARWNQYYPGDNLGFIWNKMPHLMLGKCAEALALRKAFPNELSGMYTKEEMEQADRDREPENTRGGAKQNVGQLSGSHENSGRNETGGQQPRNLSGELKGAEVGRDGTIKKSGYDPNNPEAVEYLQKALEGYPDLPKSKYLDVEKAMIGKQSFKLPEVVKAVMGGANG